ncbi:disease resistance protein RUN1-like, partial [Fagus crenata]
MRVVHSPCRRESLVIQEIIGVICGGESCSFPLSSSVLLVGIDSRVDEIISSLEIGLTDVRMIGICGMGGIGKTTIARVAYERLANQFEGSSFLADVGVGANKESGLICLQERLLFDILVERDTRISNVHEGVDLIRTRLCTKKILLVLDDVNRFEQLEALARNGFFGRGSRIIITSRDRHLLSAFGVDKINEPKLLNSEEALGLFSFKSFRNKDPPKEYLEMSKYFVYYAHGVPLVINVWGSFLFRRTIQEWKGALDKVKLNPTLEIWDLLKIGFDGLDKMEREIFLDIACFFKGEDKDRVIKILDVLGYADVGLMILIEKSLLTISSDNRLWMHDVVQEMAREIVRQECVEEPAKRSRLWKQEDIDDVLSKNKGVAAIEEIVLNLSVQNEVPWNPEAFSKMHNLRFLKIGNVQLPRGLTHFPNALKLVEWSEYPLKSLPTNFHPRELVELNMCRGNFELLWQGVK